MRHVLLIFAALLLSCKNNQPKSIIINDSGNSLKARILAPSNYYWKEEEPNSFGDFLQNLALEPDGTPILNYYGIPIDNQSEHAAVLSYDVGTKDLQQCADAIIRLRAEYLFETGQYSEIGFHFTSGDLFTWDDYKNGYRPVINSSNGVSFEKMALENDSKSNFRKYLDIIFTYAGTISLNNETIPLTAEDTIKTGDIIINPGSPGHAVLIAATATNNNENIYLLVEGYTPAQSIHVLTNPFNDEINPWYKITLTDKPLPTARYTFNKTNIRRFR